jgi:hypothetical protein
MLYTGLDLDSIKLTEKILESRFGTVISIGWEPSRVDVRAYVFYMAHKQNRYIVSMPIALTSSLLNHYGDQALSEALTTGEPDKFFDWAYSMGFVRRLN